MRVACLVDPASFESTSSGGIVGRIRLDLDGEPFPDPEWFDFPIVILEWWLAGLTALAQTRSRSAELLFMEGPYMVKVVRRPKDASFRVDAVRRSRRGIEVLISDTIEDLESLVGGIAASARDALRECEKRGWATDEMRALQDRLRDADP